MPFALLLGTSSVTVFLALRHAKDASYQFQRKTSVKPWLKPVVLATNTIIQPHQLAPLLLRFISSDDDDGCWLALR